MGKSTQLSEHFSLEEFTRSDAASKYGIDNTKPTQMQVMRMESLCDNILEPIRRNFQKPVHILSGWRSPDLNAKLGGVADSQHMRGEAADIMVEDTPHVWVFNFVKDHLNFDQLIAEQLKQDGPQAGWIHVSYCTGKKRGEVLSFLGAGKYVKGLQFV